MKKYIILLVSTLLSVSVLAQKKDLRESELHFIKSQEILSNEEFNTFTTIFNNYKDSNKQIKQETKCIKPEAGAEITEEQATAIVSNKIVRKTKMAAAYAEYITSMQTKFTNKQVLSILKAQDKFRKASFKKMHAEKIPNDKH